MKNLKFILFLLVSAIILSCSDDNSEPPFILSNANIAGTYNISSLSIDAKATAVTSGIPVTISNATTVGDTFQFNFVLNANGNYTASGQYRILSTVTPIGSSPITDISIINTDDSGTYQINSSNNTITFTSSTGDFIEGTLNVVIFNENTFSLAQEIEEVDGPITNTINASISFTRQ
jgi:hypothetical protein